MTKISTGILGVVIFVVGFIIFHYYNQQTIMSTQKFYPVVITSNLQETVSFYETLLKGNKVFESDWYVQLVNEQGIEIGVMLENQGNQPPYLQRPYDGNGVILTIEVDDVANLYKEVQTTSVGIVYELKDEEWGQRHFMVKDPNGLVVDFVQFL